MSSIFQEEEALFAQKEALLRQYEGKYVLFRDGQVQSLHDTQEEAFTAGVRKYGRDGVFLARKVSGESLIPLRSRLQRPAHEEGD